MCRKKRQLFWICSVVQTLFCLLLLMQDLRTKKGVHVFLEPYWFIELFIDLHNDNEKDLSIEYVLIHLNSEYFFNTTLSFSISSSSNAGLHESAIFQLNMWVTLWVPILEDIGLLTQLNAGDIVAQVSKYHWKCLLNLYNCTWKIKEMQEQDLLS